MKSRAWRWANVFAFFCLIGISPCLATAATVSPTDDAYVRDGSYANTNFGTATSLLAKKVTTLNSGYNREVYLKFSLASVSSITSAKLRLNAKLNTSGTLSAPVYGVSDFTWSESTLTWNNRPAKGSVLQTLAVSGTSYQWYEIDVTAYAQAAKAAGKSTLSFAIEGNTNLNSAMFVQSKEASTSVASQLVLNGTTVVSSPSPSASPTATPVSSPSASASPSPSPIVVPSSSPVATGQMFIKSSELMAKPTSGGGWTFIKSAADSSWGTVSLSDQNLFTQSYVLAGALVYARTGITSYRDKVIAALKKVPGTEVSSSTQLLALARTLYGYVVSADLVGMDYSIVCNNGETWLHFLQRIRTTVIPGNSRWQTLEFTSGNTAANWGAYSLSSHLAVSYALNDTAAIQRDINIFRRFLGDTTSPWPAFQPTAGYTYNGNGKTWDMTPTMQRGINPPSATDPRAGAIIEDALRLTPGGSDSVPCCTVQPAAVDYQEENLDGTLSTAQLLRAHGVDMTSFETSAMKRAFTFYWNNGGPGPYSVSRYLPYAINYLYGTSFPMQAEDRPYRHMGYGSWLFTGSH